ncbi:KxYKxGKxW signal peptide domain-containing protein [Weissella ceti]|uniref:KxYKxGKxW signal peptide domain-containing protein n=1 Tax=Weissella ceti TaxID=759620 RepID=A0ABT3E4E5_9LACO|nr:KxYKxGKxW signal peptide domain-containing protein [Weissella ceti]MCW0953294.1 KxYKxGKxW signal peptide domain-containing protein [Weissella ceti]QVK12805.1 GA module-containing protein [Weissella ceti]
MNKNMLKKPEVTKTNFKMYKDGKHWVFAGLMLLTVPMALMGSLEVSAAETEKKVTSATASAGDEADTVKMPSIESPSLKEETTSESTEDAVTPTYTENVQPMLAISKADALARLEKFTYLTSEQKKTYADRINNAGVILGNSVDWIIEQAEATNTIRSYDNIKDYFALLESQVNRGTSSGAMSLNMITQRAKAMSEIRALNVPEGETLINIVKDEAAVTATVDNQVDKAKRLKSLRALPNLTEADKTKFAKEIMDEKADSAHLVTTKSNVANSIRGNAGLDDAKDKNGLITLLDTVDPALVQKRADAIAGIRTAEHLDVSDVTNLRVKMINATDQNLQLFIDQGTSVNKIRGNQSLTNDDKNKLANQILSSSKSGDITFTNQKASDITDIRDNKTLTTADQDALVKLIVDGVSSNSIKLSNQKASEMTKVRNMKNLTDAEKSQLNAAISAAKTVAEVTELGSKAAAMDEIRGRKITDNEKNTLNEGVFKAVEGSGLPILGWGKVTVDEQVGAAKGKATMVEEVRGMQNLTQTEKNVISKTIMEAGSKDVADFEMERAKYINALRGMDALTDADKNTLATQMMNAKDSLDLKFAKQKAEKVQNARKNYNKLTPQQMEKFATDLKNSKTVLGYELVDKKASSVNEINGMDALTQSEKNVFIKELQAADSQSKVQNILDRANKLHEEMKAIGGSKLDLDITNDVKVKYPQTDRNIKLESLSVRYIQKNQETNKDGRVMLNAHVRVPWGLNIQQLISNEGVYLQIPHTLGTDFEVEFIQNGQKQKVKWDPAGGTWRMETGGMLIVSGDEDLEIRVSFKPKKLEKSDFLTIGYERQKNIIDTWLTGGINDQIIIEFGDAAEDINNLHDANQGVDKITEEAVTEEEKKDAQDLRDELDEITNSEDLKDFLDKIEKLQEVKDAKDKAKETLDNLHNLSKEEKDAFLDQINKGTNLEEIQRIVDEAKAKDAQNLAEAQKEANDAIQYFAQSN